MNHYKEFKLKEFLYLCLNEDVTNFDKCNYIKSATNFDKKSLEWMLEEITIYVMQNATMEYDKYDRGSNESRVVTTTIFSYLAHIQTELIILEQSGELYFKKEIDKQNAQIEHIFSTNTGLSDKLSAFRKLFSPKFIINSDIYRLVTLEVMVREELDEIASGTIPKQDKSKQLKQPLTFAGLFKPEYIAKLDVLFERLKDNGYTDENNEWIIKSDTNEPAKLFHYLNDRNVIIATKFAPAIKCFYNEFGCEVVEKDNGNPRATTRKNANDSKNSVNESDFNKFLLPWINKK